ncbi:MAG: hypothetical protein L0H70_09245, partial [Xanthomonadales bacterium]|nr:hypothetical protein [Xanthomonadales bacterium]
SWRKVLPARGHNEVMMKASANPQTMQRATKTSERLRRAMGIFLRGLIVRRWRYRYTITIFGAGCRVN